jgi:radical SAM superfamily enzyme YgiQ (UPF0313 family)
MLDILFVVTNGPKKKVRGKLVRQFSAGVGYLTALMVENGFTCDVIDFDLAGITASTLVDELARSQPRVVGFSALTEGIDAAVNLAALVKRVSPGTWTVLGGPHGTFLGEELVARSAFDVVVRSEAEGTLVTLMAALKWRDGRLDGIDGLIYRQRDKVVSTHPPAFHDNLDELPFPLRHLFPSRQYEGRSGIISARGCPFSCVFCNAQALSGKSYRMRSAESVFDEIAYLHDQGVRFFTFLDDLTTLNRRRLQRICELILTAGIDIHWGVESRVDTLSEDLCVLMYRAGCRGIHFGVESGDDDTLKDIRKKINRDKVVRAVSMAHAAGLQVMCSFIVGNPTDSRESIARTFAFVAELHEKYRATSLFSALTPFPGTELYQRPEEFGLQIHARSFSEYSLLEPMISTRRLTLEDLRELMGEARRLEARTSIVRERLEKLKKEAVHV